MCNASNHPPGCRCGWGHGWHAGGRHIVVSELSFRTQRSYTVPNASCPVCSANVFYYESPHGGRVFFDSLGPPWPKHPCTDNGRGSTQRPRPAGLTPNNGPKFEWQEAGWWPFTIDRVQKVQAQTQLVWNVSGHWNGQKLTLTIEQAGFPEHGLCQVRRLEYNVYEIWAMYLEAKSHQVQFLNLNGYTNGSASQRPARPVPGSILIKRDDPRHPEYQRQFGKSRSRIDVNKEKLALERQRERLKKRQEAHENSKPHHKNIAENQRRTPQQATAMELAFAAAKAESKGN